MEYYKGGCLGMGYFANATNVEEFDASSENIASERARLMRELGELLYPVTKSDERFFLMAPELYLAIARLDKGSSADNAAATF